MDVLEATARGDANHNVVHYAMIITTIKSIGDRRELLPGGSVLATMISDRLLHRTLHEGPQMWARQRKRPGGFKPTTFRL